MFFSKSRNLLDASDAPSLQQVPRRGNFLGVLSLDSHIICLLPFSKCPAGEMFFWVLSLDSHMICLLPFSKCPAGGMFFWVLSLDSHIIFLLPFGKCPAGEIFFGYYHWIHIEFIGFLRSDAPLRKLGP